MTTDTQRGGQWNADALPESAGFSASGNQLIVGLRAVLWDYDGAIDSETGLPIGDTPMLRLEMVADDGTRNYEYLKAGELQHIKPNPTGEWFVNNAGAFAAPTQGSNAGAWIMSLFAKHFPQDRPPGSLNDVFARVYVAQDYEEITDPRGRKRRALVVQGIHSLPWETTKYPGVVPAEENLSVAAERAQRGAGGGGHVADAGTSAPAAPPPPGGNGAAPTPPSAPAAPPPPMNAPGEAAAPAPASPPAPAASPAAPAAPALTAAGAIIEIARVLHSQKSGAPYHAGELLNELNTNPRYESVREEVTAMYNDGRLTSTLQAEAYTIDEAGLVHAAGS